jgi:hypothetical protein
MAKKKIYRTVVSFVVLSEEPINENESLNNIADEMYDGDYVGGTLNFKQTEVIGKSAVNELNKLGSCAEFLNMDNDGNELLSEDEIYPSDFVDIH